MLLSTVSKSPTNKDNTAMSVTKEQGLQCINEYLTVNNMTEEEFLKRYGFVHWAQGNSMYEFMEIVTNKDWSRCLPFDSINEVSDYWVEMFCNEEDTNESILDEIRTFHVHWDENFNRHSMSSMIG